MPAFPRADRPTVGFLLASLHTGASRALWPGLLDAAERQDVNLISFPGGRLNASTAFESQRNLIFNLASSQCLDGMISWASSLGGVLSPAETSAFHQRFRELPMVSLAQFLEGLPTVALDSYHGMRTLLTHLIRDHGYRRLAFIRGPEEHYYAQERYHAYLDTLQAFQLPLLPELVTRPLRWESGAEAIQILLDERKLVPGRDFQAVVAVSDMLALWGLKSLQARGFNIPADVAVTGFNDSIEERLATPPLTTVNLPFYEQGAKAVDLLLAQLNGETIPALITLAPSLIIRQSCGCTSEAVQQAAYLPIEDPRLEGDHLLRDPSHRNQCLAEITSLTGQGPAAFAGLLDALLSDLESTEIRPLSSKFLKELAETLDGATQAGHDLSPWNGVISTLRRWVLPGISLDGRASFEALMGQARVILSEAIVRSHAYWQWQSERQTDQLRDMNRALLTTFDISHLGDVLAAHLPGLGIPSAYLVLYEGDPSVNDMSRLWLACTEQGQASIDTAGWLFPTAQFLPPEVLPRNRRYSLVAEPLFFQDKPLGYAVFENGPRDGNIYELLRSTLSSAIQGARLFEEIQHARQQAEKADRIKSRLLANVTHELRTPLNIIMGCTHELLEQKTGEAPILASRSNVQSIQDHAEHQLRVINDLLDLSRAEIDELDLSLELLDPLPLLHEAFHAIADRSANPQVSWQLELPERLPVIRADPVRFRQILLNLLSNAQKYTSSGQVTFGCQVEPPNVHFWIRDTGGGIPPEQQERIFEPFVSIEDDKRISGGIGLGLSITRHLVALHGGKMSLESEVGKGSTFHFLIPLPALEGSLSGGGSAQPVLLLISSAAHLAPDIQTIAVQQGLQIYPIASLQELEACLPGIRPLAIAWDMASAQVGDWALIRRLRHHPSASQASFIFYGQQPQGEEMQLGLTSILVKTPTQESVLTTIESLCPKIPAGTLLIVDDDPQARQALQYLVESHLPGCAILQAEDGEAALKIMETQSPSLVLLDMVMPRMSGMDVLDHMRQDPALRQVPVIILSNKSFTSSDLKRLEGHARVVFQSKGIWSEAELAAAVNRALFGQDSLPPHTSALVKGAIAYMQQNYTRPVSRWEIAEALGVSEDYITRVFNRELGISPWEYLNRFRILQAMLLLKKTSQSIGAIARLVGFKDQAYFSRVFHQHNGLSPQAFRESPGKM